MTTSSLHGDLAGPLTGIMLATLALVILVLLA